MRAINPFPGLRPFGANESHLFFGREVATDDLLRKLRTNRFIAVVGTSGSGKSSLVRAGMLPDLYGGFMVSAGSNWRVAVFRPGDAPIHALAEALAAPEVFGPADGEPGMETPIVEIVLQRGALGLVDVTRQARMAQGENLLVVVDQFEELFRFKESVKHLQALDEAAAFVKRILAATRQDALPIYVVITMRSEYLGDCTQFRDLPEAINAGQYLIPRMTRDQQRKALTGPIAVGGAEITPPLVQRLLNDVGDSPDQLPIMQHAMMRTWDHWAAESKHGEALDIYHYEAIGGMGEALSRHADEAWNELPDEGMRTLAERLFKRLTGKGNDNREIRSPTRVGELCAITGAEEKQIIDVIDVFRREGRSFLMPPSNVVLSADTLIDISHESLIRIWDRLKVWVEEEAQSARIYRRLADTATLHERGEAGLWRAPDLQIALAWRARNHPSEPWASRYHAGFVEAMVFLDKSHSAARRRRVVAMAPAVILPLVLVGLGVNWIVNAWQQDKKLVDVLAEELNTTTIMASQLANHKDKLEAENKKNVQQKIQQLTTEVSETAEQLKDEQRQKERLRALLADVETELDGLPIERQRAAELKEKLDKTVNALDTQSAEKQQELETHLTEASTELYVVSEKAANSSSDYPAEDQEIATADDTTLDTAAFESVELYGINTLADLDSKDTLTIRQQLEILRRFSEEIGNDAEKTAARSRIQELEHILANTANIVSQENFVTCKNVDRLEPEAVASRFAPGRVYAFARIHAPKDETLKLIWRDEDGRELRKRDFKVKRNMGRGFRTFSYKIFTEAGTYEVRLYNQDQYLIGYRQFTIEYQG